MTVPQTFTATLQGSKITDYRVIIRKNSDNTILHDSTKITLPTAKFNGDILEYEVPVEVAFSGVREMKWTIETWNDADSALSRERFFRNYEPFTVSITALPNPIAEQSYTFTVDYLHPQSIDAERYRFTLYNIAGVVLDSPDWILNGSLRYTFDNFISGQQYAIECEVVDFNGVSKTTERVGFTVTYAEPNVIFTPTAENLPDKAGVQLNWSGAYSLEGVPTGTFNYTDDFIYDGNIGVNLDSGAEIQWDEVNIQEDFTTMFWFNPTADPYSGDLFEVSNSETSDFLRISYDGTRFVKQSATQTQATIPYEVLTSKVYLILFSNSVIAIKEFALGAIWAEYATSLWGDFTTLTWGDLI